MKFAFSMQNAEKNFGRVVDELATLPGLNIRTLLKAEAGSILKKSLSETPKPNPDKVAQDAAIRILRKVGLTRGGQITINAGKRGPFGRVFFKGDGWKGYRRTYNADFTPIQQHYRPQDWRYLQGTVAMMKPRLASGMAQARESAGVARASWVDIAESLGIDLTRVPGGGGVGIKELKALRLSKRHYVNGASKEEITGSQAHPGRYFITLINRLPYGGKLRFQGILNRAIAGRVSYITTAMQKGTFASIDSVIKKFPAWQIKKS